MLKRVILLLCVLFLFTACGSRVDKSDGIKVSKDGITVEEIDGAGVLTYNISLPQGYGYTLYLTDEKGVLQYRDGSCNIDIANAITLKTAIDNHDYSKLKADCTTDSITLLGANYNLVNSTLYRD